jgi:hypothetical protein
MVEFSDGCLDGGSVLSIPSNEEVAASCFEERWQQLLENVPKASEYVLIFLWKIGSCLLLIN